MSDDNRDDIFADAMAWRFFQVGAKKRRRIIVVAVSITWALATAWLLRELRRP